MMELSIIEVLSSYIRSSAPELVRNTSTAILIFSWVLASYFPPPSRVLMVVVRTPTLCRDCFMVALSAVKFWHVSRMWAGVSGTPQTSQLGSSAKLNLNRLCFSLEWPMRSPAMAVWHLLFLEDVHGRI